MSELTEAEAVATLAKQSVAVQRMSVPEGMPDLLVFTSGTIKSLEAYGLKPSRKRAMVTLHEAKSFINYVKAHAIPAATALFGSANEAGGSFNAIIDYHHTDVPEDKDATLISRRDPMPSWGEHQVVFNLEMTPEWVRWCNRDEELMTQTQFCEFIEDNMLDIVEPAGADMLEIVQLIEGTKGVTFKSGKNLKNGAIDFTYSEEVNATARRDNTMQVPAKFTLELVPFVGALGVRIEARLRYQISASGQLSLKYLLNRPHHVIRDAFNATRDQIESETKIPVLLGSAQIKNPVSS